MDREGESFGVAVVAELLAAGFSPLAVASILPKMIPEIIQLFRERLVIEGFRVEVVE